MSKNSIKEKKGLEGLVKRHPDGFGFFIPDELGYPDVYIPRKYMIGVMSQDRVRVDTFVDGPKDRFRGVITKILKRTASQVMGRAHLLSPVKALLLDESHAWGEDLTVDLSDGEKVNDGDWIKAEIIEYPSKKTKFRGRLLEVIGDDLNPLLDLKRVLHEHMINDEFPQDVVKEAGSFSQEVLVDRNSIRKDLTDLDFITIDGVTAKDFDDAICIRKVAQGFNLLVAIADVSHYVKTGSSLDKEAYSRGNSTYFPSYVVPMLPEELSNELCSLKPNVNRYAMVADLEIDHKGQVLKSSFYEAVIKSKARVTYGQAQEILEDNSISSLAHVEGAIKIASDLAKILIKKRTISGTLSMEIPETEIELDEAGNIIDILKSERLFAHKLIEEMMLVANIAVADFLVKKEVISIFRVHDEPKQEALDLLQSFATQFGKVDALKGNHLQKKISKVIALFKGEPQEPIINMLTLRSMAQAVYTEQNIGHFGLGFNNYAHFTSPIRRYPDLIIHRLLKSVIYPKIYKEFKSEEDMHSAGVHLSSTEQRSVKAERQYKGIKKAKFMSQFIGQQFDGIVSSVAKFGLFVTLRQYDIDGLVKIESIGGRGFEFDDEKLLLFNKRSGVRYCIGDMVKVDVVDVNLDQGKIDFILVDGSESKNNSTSKKTKTKTNKYPTNKEKQKSKPNREKQKNKPSREKKKNKSKRDEAKSSKKTKTKFKKKKVNETKITKESEAKKTNNGKKLYDYLDSVKEGSDEERSSAHKGARRGSSEKSKTSVSSLIKTKFTFKKKKKAKSRRDK